MKILVTEDDKITGKVLQKILLENGYDVKLCLNAVEAKKELLNSRFDVLLVDVYMPDIDGISFISQIRNELKLMVPIAIVTRDKDENLVKKAFETGADDFILKPFEKNDLLKRIKKLAAMNI